MSVNKVILVGNVGKDPVVRYLDTGVAVGNFSLATTDRAYKLPNGTEVPEKTEWHNIVLWRGLAEIAEKYVRKGSQIYIEGKIRTRSYEDKGGGTRYITEIFADNMQLLGRKPEGQLAPLEGQILPTTNQSTTPPTVSESAPAAPSDDLPF